jgi:hypothetical protein
MNVDSSIFPSDDDKSTFASSSSSLSTPSSSSSPSSFLSHSSSSSTTTTCSISVGDLSSEDQEELLRMDTLRKLGDLNIVDFPCSYVNDEDEDGNDTYKDIRKRMEHIQLNMFDVDNKFRDCVEFKDMISNSALADLNKDIEKLRSKVALLKSDIFKQYTVRKKIYISRLHHPYIFRDLYLSNTKSMKGFTVKCRGKLIPKTGLVGILGGNEYYNNKTIKEREATILHHLQITPHLFHCINTGTNRINASKSKPCIDTHLQNPHKWGIMQFINHSLNDEECNVKFIRHKNTVFVVATKQVNVGDELIINYNNHQDYSSSSSSLSSSTSSSSASLSPSAITGSRTRSQSSSNSSSSSSSSSTGSSSSKRTSPSSSSSSSSSTKRKRRKKQDNETTDGEEENMTCSKCGTDDTENDGANLVLCSFIPLNGTRYTCQYQICCLPGDQIPDTDVDYYCPRHQHFVKNRYISIRIHIFYLFPGNTYMSECVCVCVCVCVCMCGVYS